MKATAIGAPDKSTDLRTERTRSSLWRAMVSLTAARGYDAITVSDITSGAGVGRATFYRHYEDKEDLFRQGCVDLLDSILGKIRASLPEDGSEWTPPHFGRLFALLDEERETLRILCGRGSNPEFRRIVADKIEAFSVQERFRSLASTAEVFGDPQLADLYAHAVSALLIGLATWWLAAPAPMPADRVAEAYGTIVAGALKEILACSAGPAATKGGPSAPA